MAQPYDEFLDEILIDETTLKARIAELGKQISADYADLDGCLLLICILKGGVMFLCDLMRYIEIPHEIDFMAVSSYGIGARETSRNVRIDMDLTASLTGKHVLIVEDIIDSGYTLNFVMEFLGARKPASLRLCTLLDKTSRREIEIAINYTGFEIEDKYVFGYGLDIDERFRNLPFIGAARVDSS
jgi:hypoxanthine phosphoribosyltransferase